MDVIRAVRRLFDEWEEELLERLAALLARGIAEHEARCHRNG